ncbi:hypothetical protein AB4232_03060 [Vibrio sp. 10N.286.46.A8]|uniref:hypothetical protein n=1 Tax=Vibrio sp. 10N.286.46.A8 TaxID=3229697 RepID=UPI003552885C
MLVIRAFSGLEITFVPDALVIAALVMVALVIAAQQRLNTESMVSLPRHDLIICRYCMFHLPR